MVANETARLISFAINDPKNMPKYEPIKPKAEIPHDVQTEIVRAWLMSKVKH